ncbi:MAG TPA: anti-sigma factor [Candidatus Dormibacteraeota bacterium]|nr:anti-sigma factor [Candidatus Dormibacteraeota bacterium]
MTADHDSMEDAVAAYVLGACPDDERAVIRAHLDDCASCRELARRLREAVDVLALSCPGQVPPARLRRRILDAARSSPPSLMPVADGPGREAEVAPRLAGRRRPLWRGRLALAAAAMLLVGLAGTVAWNLRLQQELDRRPPTYVMQGTGPLASARGSVTDVDAGQLTLVSFSAMPPPPPGHVYEVWLVMESGKVVPAGTFRPDARGDAHLLLQRPLSGVQTVSVTQEVAPRGSSAPRGKPLMAAQVGS